jgi:ubiquinone/menaquinone biosynthesis C-methylase UbiE
VVRRSHSWASYLNDDLDYTAFPAGALVADVGCGTGEQLRLLKEAGCHPVGLETSAASLRGLRQTGYDVLVGRAEAIPLAAESVDGVVCKVVLPYTDERRAIAEWARVLRRGGMVRACYHGMGYYLNYLVEGESLAQRFYGARTLANTVVYWIARRRLPGWLGDTLFQSPQRLRAYYRSAGLELREEWLSRPFLGAPVFIYHLLVKR